MPNTVLVRPLRPIDSPAWLPLWNGYNAFYGRHDATALPPEVTRVTWQRLLRFGRAPVFALVAEEGGELLGLALTTSFIAARRASNSAAVCRISSRCPAGVVRASAAL